MRNIAITVSLLAALLLGFFANTLVSAAHAEPTTAPDATCAQFANLRNQSRLEEWMNEQIAAGKTNMIVPSTGVLCAW